MPSHSEASILLSAMEQIIQQAKQQLDDAFHKTKRDLEQEIISLQQQRDTLAKEIQQQEQQKESKKIDLLREIQEERQQLALQREELLLLEAKLRRVSQQAPFKVKLNVGGQVFPTLLDTLTSEKHTFFSIMFSEHFALQHDADGEIFIDRDPRIFRLVLNHMRKIDITPFLENLSKEDRALLEQDADFYQIESLKQLLMPSQPAQTAVEWEIDLEKKHSNLTVTKNADGTTSISQNGGRMCNPVVGSKGLSSGVHEWKVRLDNTSTDGQYVFLGVCKLDEMMPFINDTVTGTNTACKMFYGKDNYYGKRVHGTSEKIGRTWKSGDVATIVLDCDKGQLFVDDVSMDLEVRSCYYPVFMLYGRSACTLL